MEYNRYLDDEDISCPKCNSSKVHTNKYKNDSRFGDGDLTCNNCGATFNYKTESYYGYGSVTGRMSPRDSWEQGYLPDGKNGYGMKIPEIFWDFRNAGMHWNDLPSDVQELWKSYGSYRPSGESKASESPFSGMSYNLPDVWTCPTCSQQINFSETGLLNSPIRVHLESHGFTDDQVSKIMKTDTTNFYDMNRIIDESYASEDSLVKIEDDDDKDTKVTVLDEWENETNPDVGESWSRKSFNQKVEALEAVGFRQGKALRFASLAFEDFSEDLQNELANYTEEDAEDEQEFIEQTREDEIEAGLIDEVDYNNIGESRTARSKYECEFCNCGFKSNESLTIHYNDLHAVPPAHIDGYENWKEVADDLYKKELAKLKKRGGEAYGKEFIPIDWAGQVGSTKSEKDQDTAYNLMIHVSDLEDKYGEGDKRVVDGIIQKFGTLTFPQAVVDILEDENYHSINRIISAGESVASEWGMWAEEPKRMTPDEEADYLRNLGIDDKTLKQIGHQGYHRKNHIPRGESYASEDVTFADVELLKDATSLEDLWNRLSINQRINIITSNGLGASVDNWQEIEDMARAPYNEYDSAFHYLFGGMNINDVKKYLGIESVANEDDYKYDFEDLTSLAQDKIESSGVTQSEWDSTPEKEREELEKEIREAYNPSDLVCPECGDITKDDKEFDDHLSAHRFNESYSKESFDFHSDAGHGWLEVPKSLLKELGIAKQISRLSYQKGNKVYIEEDGDYMTFKKAYEEKYGSLPVNELPQKDDDSPIRDYQPYGGY